jgi:beta-glucosidase
MGFCKDFVWGAASAAYQIEGAAYEDGKGLSVWDVFSQQPGKIWEAHNGDVACDHYHRYKEDVTLMQQIGLQAYRMSIAWTRILPDGIGKVNQKGLDFYDRLVDELLAAGIQPWITLFHWDYPYELYCQGGWLNPRSPDWFAEYTRTVVERLSDRVGHWLTINEPQCFIGLGHQTGSHAPGLKLELPEVLRAAHHTLMAHGKAVQTIRAYARQPAKIGMASLADVNIPATTASADIEAARRVTHSVRGKNLWNNTWWYEPALRGSYPADGLELFGKDMPVFTAAQMQVIHQPLDFFGVNIYQARTVRAGAEDKPEEVKPPSGSPQTALRWYVTPEAMYWGPKFFYERYNLPVVITENGLSNIDWVGLDGKVHDPQRIDFVQRYLQQYQRAGEAGVELLGYFLWSLMDNFEWAEGFKERFGLIYVDYATQKRTLKDSAYWYGDFIRHFPNTEPDSLASDLAQIAVKTGRIRKQAQ